MAEYYVATDGTAEGDGSIGDPWDLQTALDHPGAVDPGDTIWLRGGTYTGLLTSDLTGTDIAPIIVRSYPDEWAIIDTEKQSGDGDAIVIRGEYTWYWDFEVTNTEAVDRGGSNFAIGGSANFNKFINLIIHDAENNSFGDSNDMYGCVMYNNGKDGSGLEHHLYTQNDDAENPCIIQDCIIGYSFAFGIHAYAGGVGLLAGIHMIGNVLFKNGESQTGGDTKDNILVGGVNGCSNILLQENMTWAARGNKRNVALGRYSNLNEDATLTDNYIVGATTFENDWSGPVAMTGNTFYEFIENSADVDPGDYLDNDYLTEEPVANVTFIRQNDYDATRSHIIVYNWEMENTVDVDVSGVLTEGYSWEVRNGQHYFAAAVASGSNYAGGSITLPMTGLEPAQPTPDGLIAANEKTGAQFNVFVLLSTDGYTSSSSASTSDSTILDGVTTTTTTTTTTTVTMLDL